jgi:hypothetical protein
LNFHSVTFSSFHLEEITLPQAKINISIAEANINTSKKVITFSETTVRKLSHASKLILVQSENVSGFEVKDLSLLLVTNTSFNNSGIFINNNQVKA